MSLTFRDVHYAYPGVATPALSGASVDMRPGTAVALVGRNGSGKSTLMLLANGILRPSAGSVELDGRSVSYDRRGLVDLRSQVGVVFQNPEDQLFSASVAQDLSLGPLNLGLDDAEARRRVAWAAERCDLGDLLDRPTHALSGGEKARAALAGVLAMRPRYLFADELTNSLDPWMRANVLDIFDGLVADGSTVVLATHDLALAGAWADEVAWMDGGVVRACGPAAEVLGQISAPGPRRRRAAPGRSMTRGPDAPSPSREPRTRGRTKALLAVSFGTTHADTREAAIAATERDLERAFPDHDVRRAFTSGVVIRRLRERDGIETDAVSEALRRLADEGYEEVLVQPLHLLCGTEYHRLLAELAPSMTVFPRVGVGRPLLAAPEDYPLVAEALRDGLPACGPGEAILLMGHGSRHPANAAYAALAVALRAAGMDHVHVATVDGSPTLEDAIAELEAAGTHAVTLVPFMLVAGEHARNDMAGDEAGSWGTILGARGYEVATRLTGLGELPAIRAIYVDHARAAQEEAVR